MVPSAVRWAYAVHAAVRTVPARELMRPARTSLTAVVWVLAAAADYDDRIPADHTAAMLTREAGVRTGTGRSAPRGCANADGCNTDPVGNGTGGSWSLAPPP